MAIMKILFMFLVSLPMVQIIACQPFRRRDFGRGKGFDGLFGKGGSQKELFDFEGNPCQDMVFFFFFLFFFLPRCYFVLFYFIMDFYLPVVIHCFLVFFCVVL